MFARFWITDLLNLVFPQCCPACGKLLVQQEKALCFSCLYKLPRTGFHLQVDNPVARIFWGRTHLHSATSFLFFSKGGKVQNLIHALKYRGKQDVGTYLGEVFGRELKKSPLFNTVEVIVPVPLHPKKQHKRGFNQSECLADGLARGMQAQVNAHCLYRAVHTESQTRKSRYERWKNVKDVFRLRQEEELAGKHLLLVDDVLTTGATLEACAQTLQQLPGVKISVATLACAQG